MLFLKDPKLKLGYQHDTFPYATKKEVQSAAARLMDRLFSVQMIWRHMKDEEN